MGACNLNMSVPASGHSHLRPIAPSLKRCHASRPTPVRDHVGDHGADAERLAVEADIEKRRTAVAAIAPTR